MRRVPALALAIMVPVAAAAQRAGEDVCPEAEARFEELYGRRRADEPITTVLMYKYRFCPADIRIKAGEKLRYINVDKRTSHSVWLKDAGQKESERVFGEGVIEVDTRLPTGDHQVLCGPHWQSDGMIGKIIVEK